MAMFENLRSLFAPNVRHIYSSDYGVRVADMNAAQLYRTQPNLRAAVSFLADNAAQVPLKVHERAGDNDRPRVTDSPAALLLKSPNPDMTPFEFKRWMYSDLLLYERFLMLVVPSAETPSGFEMRPVPNSWIAEYKGASPFAPEAVTVMTGRGSAVEVPAGKFVLFHGYDPNDPMRQCSRISALKETLHEQVESNAFRRQMWRRGGRFNAYLTRPKEVEGWSPEAFERFKETWKASWAGSEASDGGGMPILEDGMEIKTVQFNSRDAQWYESVKLAREDVAAVYHFNPALLWPGSGQTYASAKDNARALYNDCLASTLMQATDRINHTLLPMVGEPANDYVVYDITIKTQGTLEERISALQTACGGPFMSREEVRALIDLPREPDGDLIVPLNVLVGGLASSHDTDPTQERYNAATVGAKASSVVLDDPKGDEPPVSRKAKGDPAEESVDELAGVYRAFFERQRNSVAPKIESGAANWWNAGRWDRELADDLYPVALRQADEAGEDAVKALWPDDPSRKYGKEQTAAYISKMCLVRAQAVNAVTHRELMDAIDDGGKVTAVDSKGLRSTIGGVFANAILNRSRSTASALACALVGFATMEGVKQNRRRGESVYKTWRTTSGNPRASHRAMNGEQVQYDEPFSNGMMWPGDWRNGSAAEVAFCKCVLDVEVREKAEWTPGRITVEQIDARSDLSAADKAMLAMALEDAANPLPAHRAAELADFMGESMGTRAEAYRSVHRLKRTRESYDATVGALLSDIGDVYGMKLTGGFAEGASKVDPTKILESAIPNGDELWAVTRMRGEWRDVHFPSIDRGVHGNPDLLVNGRYIDIKSPKSKEKVVKHVNHAAAQCRARGQESGSVVLSMLWLGSESELCERVIRNRISEGWISEAYLIGRDSAVKGF